MVNLIINHIFLTSVTMLIHVGYEFGLWHAWQSMIGLQMSGVVKGCRVVIKFGMVVLAWPGPPLGVHWLARCVCIWSVVG